jgi:hypothetical protein
MEPQCAVGQEDRRSIPWAIPPSLACGLDKPIHLPLLSYIRAADKRRSAIGAVFGLLLLALRHSSVIFP